MLVQNEAITQGKAHLLLKVLYTLCCISTRLHRTVSHALPCVLPFEGNILKGGYLHPFIAMG